MRYTTTATDRIVSGAAQTGSKNVQLEPFAAQGVSARTATSERTTPAYSHRNAMIVKIK
jgi:hypothetical protein